MTQILPPAKAQPAIDALRAGEPVAIPTETVYGLAANALSEAAVAAVFVAKGRPTSDPLIVHVSPAMVGEDVLGGLIRLGILAEPSQAARAAFDRLQGCWPGPLTLILPRGPAIHDAITAGLDTVAVRMPSHPVAQALLDAVGLPLVAPSANRFGRISPTTAAAALEEMQGRIRWVVDGGPCTVGVESTVLRIHDDGGTTLLRPGQIPHAALAQLLGHPPAEGGPTTTGPQRAPGQLESHYAPRTPLVLVDSLQDLPWARLEARASTFAVLGWSSLPPLPPSVLRAAVLTPSGDPIEAAAALFAQLRALDHEGAALLVAERCPQTTGIGAAIRDRMQRAAAGTPTL